MTQEQNILKLLEEGDSAAIRLGHQLLSAVEHPQDPALALWKEVFLMVEQAGETEMFLHHFQRIVAPPFSGMFGLYDQMSSAQRLKWPSFVPLFAMLESAAPTGRLGTMCEMVERESAPIIISGMPTKAEFKKMLDDLDKRVANQKPREYDWGPLGFPSSALADYLNQTQQNENKS